MYSLYMTIIPRPYADMQYLREGMEALPYKPKLPSLVARQSAVNLFIELCPALVERNAPFQARLKCEDKLDEICLERGLTRQECTLCT